ncbi:MULTISPECIES: hypothetical protein [Aeromonas]|nr:MULTISPECIES: hypothetical protein [Aeromonas]MDX7852971.1 hypothetical protein [Aeromonas caviae]
MEASRQHGKATVKTCSRCGGTGLRGPALVPRYGESLNRFLVG